MFKPREIAFLPGLYANRSRRGSKQRWVDGAFVRFRDSFPQQVGGWEAISFTTGSISGVVRHIRAWRPNSQLGRYAFIGAHSEALLLDGLKISSITPSVFEAGNANGVASAGFGAGAFGAETYGTPRSTSDLFLEAHQWTSDMYGELLIACYNQSGTIYSFDVVNGDTELMPLENAPTARAVLVSDERHIFAFGAGGVAGQVDWSDREDPTDWTPEATNRAGGYQFQVISQFQCAARVRGNVIGWTLDDVVAFFPLNNALVYGQEHLSKDAGVVGPQGVAVVTADFGEVAFWMAKDAFYMFDGFVRKMDCELYDYVFDDINLNQRSQFHAGHLSEHGEVWFFYCSANSDTIDRAVVYDYERSIWSKAPLARTAWLDAAVLDAPLAIAADGTAYWHETGDDADGSPLESYVVSHPIMVGLGEQVAEINQFWPDMDPASKQCSLTLLGRDRPDGAIYAHGPYAFSPSSQKVDLAVSAREVQFRIDGGSGFWELGIPQLYMQGGGMR